MGRLKLIPLRFCEQCGKVIPRNTKQGEKRIRPTQYKKARFCSLMCKGLWQKIYLQGSKNPNYRGGVGQCVFCKNKLPNRYATKDKACSKCRGLKIIGDKHPNWRGGISAITKDLYYGRNYRIWRKTIFERDNYTCQICGDDTGHNLNAHHKKYRKYFPELTFEVDNGITLCKPCHIFIHKHKALITTIN